MPIAKRWMAVAATAGVLGARAARRRRHGGRVGPGLPGADVVSAGRRDVARTPADITERVVMFRIDRTYVPTMTEDEVSEKVRRAWRMNPHRHDPEVAFGVLRGEVCAVLRIDSWSRHEDGRWRFEGDRDRELERRYVGLDVKGVYAGSSNPVRYVNC